MALAGVRHFHLNRHTTDQTPHRSGSTNRWFSRKIAHLNCMILLEGSIQKVADCKTTRRLTEGPGLVQVVWLIQLGTSPRRGCSRCSHDRRDPGSACGDGARVLQVDRSGMCDAESDCVFCVFKPCARIPWFWGLNNNNLVKSLHFPQALTGLLPGSRAREPARKGTSPPKHLRNYLPSQKVVLSFLLNLPLSTMIPFVFFFINCRLCWPCLLYRLSAHGI
jgi:hypothetical protein